MKPTNTLRVGGKRKVCRIFDAGPESFDRYTVAFRGWRLAGVGMVYPYLASNNSPFHPQGFGQYGESKVFLTGRHLGRRITFESCPPDVQKFILQSI